MKKQYFIALVALILSGCATNQQVYQGQEIAGNEGLLLTQITCGDLITNVSIYKTGTGWDRISGIWKRDGALWCGNNYNSLTLPEGNYYISYFVGTERPLELEKDALKFSISKDKVNYIGHINLNYRMLGKEQKSTQESFYFSHSPTVDNKQELAKQYLNSELPSIASKYEFKTNIANK